MSDRRQRQKEQRKAKRAAERKAAQRSELYRRLVTGLIFGAIVIAIFVLPGLIGTNDSGLPRSYADYRSQPTACGAEAPPPETPMTYTEPVPQGDITPTSSVTATVATSCGEIVIELDAANFPATVNSFVFLAREGFYDGQVFHRVVEDFVIQGGDPEANGTGGPGYVIEDEFPEGDFEFSEGIVAMANRGARSTGSQFFIVIGDRAQFLVPGFNILGTIASGGETLDKIAAIETGVAPGSVERSLPLESVYIESITISVDGS
ncbi:MAG: peptidylprolyl isomerase [Acidimicrobiia bacterium]|nr:peptidylprolyl isomerase [Acidimicrobiia bacterium]